MISLGTQSRNSLGNVPSMSQGRWRLMLFNQACRRLLDLGGVENVELNPVLLFTSLIDDFQRRLHGRCSPQP